MKRALIGALLGICLLLGGCGVRPLPPEPEAAVSPAPAGGEPAQDHAPAAVRAEEETTKEEAGRLMLQLCIEDAALAVDWEENESAEALLELCREEPMTLSLSMYGGFEQVGPLGTSLPRSDVQITTQAGDIVLYAGNQIVLFYGSNTWAYTRLGHISGKSAEELSALLGRGDVSITLRAVTEG